MSVLIADDHPMVRDALAQVVRRALPGLDVSEAPDFAAVLLRCDQQMPVLSLLDLNMPGMDGLKGVRLLRQRFPAMRIIVVSGQDDPPTIRDVLSTGVSGFFPKSGRADLLLQAIHLVQAGGTYVPTEMLADFHDGAPPAKPDLAGLTPRQFDVLQRLLRGLPNKLIARELGLTEGTVKIHIAAILRVLRARNRTEAVVLARALGLDRLPA